MDVHKYTRWCGFIIWLEFVLQFLMSGVRNELWGLQQSAPHFRHDDYTNPSLVKVKIVNQHKYARAMM